MIRSRLIFVVLFLAYLGMTPVGVYTCACLMPTQPVLHQVDLDEISAQSSAFDTAVATLSSFFSLSFLVAAVFFLVKHQLFSFRFLLLWLEPYRFYEPPPTPPPHFA